MTVGAALASFLTSSPLAAAFASPFALDAIPHWGLSDRLGVGMAILPAPLQFLYGRFPREPLRRLQRFHVWIHTQRRLEGRPVFALMTQLAFVILFVAFSLALHRMYASTG